jgi:diguanylate cyclase (GGDEF)-like protein/PAS domain S-box-containing protein
MMMKILNLKKRLDDKWVPIKISSLYLALGTLWITFSDKLVLSFTNDVQIAMTLQTLKGWLFVIFSCVLLYFLIYRNLNSIRRSEQELVESESNLRSLINATPDFVYLKDTEGRWIEANDYMTKLFQLENISFKGKNSKELAEISAVYREIQPNCVKSDKAAWEKGQMIRVEQKLPMPDGTTVICDVIKAPIFHEDGSPKGIVVFGRDITKYKEMEYRLLEREQQYSSLFNYHPDGIFVVGRKGEIMSTNPGIQKISGYSEQELQGTTFGPIILKDDLQRTNDHFRQTKQKRVQNFQISIQHKEGFYVEVDIVSVPLIVKDEILGIIGIAQDITERKRAEEKLNYMAFHDDLTGLPNQRLFRKELRVALKQASNKKEMALLFLDLDRFKHVNDSLGHAAGDKLLQIIADRLNKKIPKNSTLARMNGDEFVLLLPKIVCRNEVEQLAQELLQDLAIPVGLEGYDFHITSSIGIALYPYDGKDVEVLIKNADIAMHRAKLQGKNTYTFYAPTMDHNASERVALENDLRKGLENEEFVVYYQPQFNIKTGQIIGAEALVRWQHPTQGIISPQTFIPLAEETGLIVPLGEWVLRTACEQNKAWQRTGYVFMPIAVNLSMRQFMQDNLVDQIAQILKETGLDSKYLELEITESMTINEEHSIHTLEQLHNLGIRVCMDDFGTGYSSLSYLKKLPISKLKIDRAFVWDINTDSNDNQIITTIIAMAHNFNLSVVAEGVETEEQIDFLRKHHCEFVQGFLLSHPLPKEELEKLILKKTYN